MARIVETIDAGNVLGECVLWRQSDRTVWWTDIKSNCLYRLSWPGLALKRFDAPGRVGCFAFLKQSDDWLLIACEDNIGLFQPESGKTVWLDEGVKGVGDGLRFNDGRVDNAGRFWVGSMYEPPAQFDPGERPGALYRLGSDGRAQPVIADIHITNGLCWSPQGDTMYLADSPTGTVWRAAYNAAIGTPGRFAKFASFTGEVPDGAVTDSAGNYWTALWGGSRIACLGPSGQESQSVPLPISQPTCVAFGGESMNMLFVTSARAGLSEEALAQQSDAGSLFVIETDSKGWTSISADYPAVESHINAV